MPCPAYQPRSFRSAVPAYEGWRRAFDRDIEWCPDYMSVVTVIIRHILSVMIALSLGMGAVAHAGEQIAESSVEMCVESLGHQDSEPSDSDADKWGLHAHGGCHGHHQADTIGRDGALAVPPLRTLNFAGGGDFLPQLVPDANLRPPIA